MLMFVRCGIHLSSPSRRVLVSPFGMFVLYPDVPLEANRWRSAGFQRIWLFQSLAAALGSRYGVSETGLEQTSAHNELHMKLTVVRQCTQDSL